MLRLMEPPLSLAITSDVMGIILGILISIWLTACMYPLVRIIRRRRLGMKEKDTLIDDKVSELRVNELPLDYITDRLLPQIKHYEKKGTHLRREYYIISILNTVTLAAVPLLAMLSDIFQNLKYFLAGSSAIASIFSAILLLRRTKDNWLECQATSDALKCELARFFVDNPDIARAYKTNILKDETLHGCMRELRNLAKDCEEIMRVERTGWYTRMKSESDQESIKAQTPNEGKGLTVSGSSVSRYTTQDN